jgi:DNA-binding IclR family transcriptional regulator
MSENKYRIDTVYTACRILEEMANSREPMGSGEIAKALGINANAAFRQCATLEEAGILRTIGGKYYFGMQLAIYWARVKSRLEAERDKIDSDLQSLEEES